MGIIAGSQDESQPEMSQTEYEAAVAEFIHRKGITRCPTACLAPTQGSVAEMDRVMLRQRAEHLEELRRERMRSARRNAMQAA